MKWTNTANTEQVFFSMRADRPIISRAHTDEGKENSRDERTRDPDEEIDQ